MAAHLIVGRTADMLAKWAMPFWKSHSEGVTEIFGILPDTTSPEYEVVAYHSCFGFLHSAPLSFGQNLHNAVAYITRRVKTHHVGRTRAVQSVDVIMTSLTYNTFCVVEQLGMHSQGKNEYNSA